jgi:hypothetical protein
MNAVANAGFRKPRRWLNPFVLISLNAAAAGIIAYHWSASANAISEEPIPVGGAIPSSALEPLYHALPGEWTHAVVLFKANRSPERAYVDGLRDALGLSTVRLLKVDDSGIRGSASTRDAGPRGTAAIRRGLHVPAGHEHDSTVIVARDGHVVFWLASGVSDDELRLLTERYGRGYVDLAPRESRIAERFEIGAGWPWMEARTFEAAPKPLHALRAATVVIFAAGCASCELGSYLIRLRELRAEAIARQRAFLILALGDSQTAAAFGEAVKLGQLDSTDIAFVTDQAAGHDPYWTRYVMADKQAFMVDVGTDGIVHDLRPLDPARNGETQ